MTRFIYLPALTLLALLSACSSSPQQDPELEAAYKFHLEALAISDSLEGYMADATGATWDSLREAHHEWEESLVEVPGFEHDHDHAHGHDHDHEHDHDNTLTDLPPVEMRKLQQALKNEVIQMLALAQQLEQHEVPVDTLSL